MDNAAKWLKGQAGKTLEVSAAENPKKFTETVKTIIDLKIDRQMGIELTFSNDFKRLKIEEFNRISELF